MKKKAIRYLSSLLLMGAIAVPIATFAQDRDDHDRDDRQRDSRVYDRRHKDYHEWNDAENRRYRDWYNDRYRGKEYRDYNKLGRKDRDDYWNWRHSHHDDDDRR